VCTVTGTREVFFHPRGLLPRTRIPRRCCAAALEVEPARGHAFEWCTIASALLFRPESRRGPVTSLSKYPGAGLTLGLAFVGGFGDAAGFVLARTFTGHVTGNLVLAAVSIAALDWATTLIRLSAVLAFLAGVFLSVLSARLAAAKQWPPLAAAFGGEIVLIGAGSLLLMLHTATGTGIFVLCMSLALGLQNGAFRRAGGVSVHTTYLTGMLTGVLITETERLFSQPPGGSRADAGGIRLVRGLWLSFFAGAAVGAALVLRFSEAGMLAIVLLLGVLLVRSVSCREARRHAPSSSPD
jgi:uncharacterized membrane protein YoaK (UPF0700 family)